MANDRYNFDPREISQIAPPPRCSVSEWCDRHRVLDAKFGAEPGRWRTQRTPYLREIMDCFSSPEVSKITFIKSARVGGTELLNNVMAYSVDARPMPILYVFPKQSDIEDEFSGRIKSLFESSPTLRDHIPGGSWASRHQLNLDSLTIYGAWASSPTTLIRKTIGVALEDEIDNCDMQAGSLGNTSDLIGVRLTTYGYRAKHVQVTTPTTTDANGWQSYLASDQRRPHVPCPECGHYQVLLLPSLKWPEGSDADSIELDCLAEYACGGCGCLIPQRRQRWMIDRTVWVPACQTIAEQLPIDNVEVVKSAAEASNPWRPRPDGDPPRGRHRGYWINALYSPWRTWSQIAAQFLRTKSNDDKFKVYKNSTLAEAWEPKVESPDESWLETKMESAQWGEGLVPPQAIFLICSVDVQGDRLEYVVRAWGAGMRSWKVEDGIVQDFEELYERVMVRGYEMATTPGERMRGLVIGVDSRYRTDEVVEFARLLGVVALRGVETAIKPVEEKLMSIKDTQTQKDFVWVINTYLFKRKLARLMQVPPDKPGAWGLNQGTSAEYLKQVTSEHLVSVTNKSGIKRWAWRPKTSGRANHKWDCEVYQLCLLEIIEQKGEVNLGALTNESRKLMMVKPSTKKPATPSEGKRVTGGWSNE